MRRCGNVVAINRRVGFVVIATNDDAYTVIESEDDFDIGDEVAWNNGYGLGCEAYENLTKGTISKVIVKDHAVSTESLKATYLS